MSEIEFRSILPSFRSWIRWVLVVGVLALGFHLATNTLRAESNAVSIAAVGPLTGSAAARGKDLEQAARMAVDEANASGGVHGHRIKLDVYDDGDQPARARELAQQIASKSSAVAVLGQVASSAAFAAGQIYKEQGIPALTGAASESRVTKDNNWFFRLLRDSAGQGRFLADYARFQFGAREIAVLSETGTSGEEFAAAMRDRAKNQGIRVVANVEFLPAQAKDPVVLNGLAEKLRALPKGGVLVLGTQYAETPIVLQALRDKLGPFIALGYSSVATEGIAAALAPSEVNRHAPGYYTDGLTVAAPQLADVAEYAQTVFASRFRARYGIDPSPEAVRWYESARLVLQAIEAKEISGSNRNADRRAIRDWLASLDHPEAAVDGVAGPIYFDHDHNVQRGLSIGTFYEGHLVSAPVQFTPVTDSNQVPGWDRLVSNGQVLDINGTTLVKTPVVYAGIELNSLDNIDVRTGTFAADFFLWFRYQDQINLDLHEVEFPTATSGVQLGKEVWRRSHGGFTTVTYHVKSVFHADYEFSRFPFDQQTLKIPIQVRNSTSYTLILVYGQTSSRSGQVNGRPANAVLSTKLWKLKNQLFYRDVVAYQSVGAGGVQINRINAAITIERDVFGFAVKNFLPLLCILIAVLIGYALAPDVINPRVSIGVTALLTTSVLYQKLAGDLPTVTYIIAMDYVFFAFFSVCVMFLALTVITYETKKANREKPTRLLNLAGTILSVIGLTGTLIFVWTRYWGQA